MSKVVTGKVRMGYVNIFEPRAAQEWQDPKYSVQVMIPKSNTATLKAIEKAVEETINEGLKTKLGGKRTPNMKLPLRDGDAEFPDDENYKGMMFFTTLS